MKKILVLLLLICSLFFFSIKNENIILADGDEVPVTDNNGDVIYYRNSSEPIMKAKEYAYPTQSLRAVWASNFVGSIPDYTTEEKWKKDYCGLLDRMETYGLNCVVFHVRTHNNALYKSELNPLATFFKGVDFDKFDPLEWAIEETHRRGIEFHAWMNPYRVSTGYCAEDFPSVNPASNPDNLLVGSSSTILNPGLPEVRTFLIDTCMELINNYDVDAINFDDYFYNSGINDDSTMKKYNPDNLSKDDWHREQVNLFIHGLSDAIRKYNKENHKAVQLGIAPSGTYNNGGYSNTPMYDDKGTLISPLYSDTSSSQHYGSYLYADTLKWVSEEWIDYMMPQMYWAIEHTSASFAALTRWWSWAVHYKKVNLYCGMGIYMGDSTTGSGAYWQKNNYEIRDQILNAQTHPEIGGICLYSYNYMLKSAAPIKTGMDILKNDYFTTKIPADVKKSYANTLPRPIVEDIELDGNILSYAKADNIRGYYIFEVKNGETLDTTDINQVYYYGTETSVVLGDTNNNSYFIATVNLANECSEFVNVMELGCNGDYVNSLIDGLPDAITSKNEETLKNIHDLYDALDNTEKAKVTKYDRYQSLCNLLEEKKNTSNKIKYYGNLGLYTTGTQASIRLLKNNQSSLIDDATSVTDLNNIYDNFINEFNKFKVAEEELSEPLLEAIGKLNNTFNSLDLKYYDDPTKLRDILDEGITKLKLARSKTDINNICNNYVNRLNGVKSNKDLYLEKVDYINTQIENYIEYKLERIDYYDFVSDKLDKEFSNFKNTLVDDVNNVINNADEIILNFEDKIDTLTDLYNDIAHNIESYVKKIKDYKAFDDTATSLINEYTNKINESTLANQPKELFEEFKTLYKYLEEANKNNNSQTNPVVIPGNGNEKGCGNKGLLIILMSINLGMLVSLVLKKH